MFILLSCLSMYYFWYLNICLARKAVKIPPTINIPTQAKNVTPSVANMRYKQITSIRGRHKKNGSHCMSIYTVEQSVYTKFTISPWENSDDEAGYTFKFF